MFSAWEAGNIQTDKELLAVYVWRWTIGVFATQSNAMAARFMSLTDEPNSAHVGVLSLGT